MKILKYIAVIAASILACSAYAADNASGNSPVSVKVSVKNGNVALSISVNPTDGMTVDAALDQALAAALSQVEQDSEEASAIAASILSIKAAMGDGSMPISSAFAVDVSVSSDGSNGSNAKASVEVNGAKFESNTVTTLNPETKVAQTSGNVTSTVDGKTASLPVAVAINAKGELVGSVGNSTVAVSVPTTSTSAAVSSTPTSVQEANAGSTTPDNTVVSSASK